VLRRTIAALARRKAVHGRSVRRACENSPFAARPAPQSSGHQMDIERINAIGSLLADLSARTQQLRGYL